MRPDACQELANLLPQHEPDAEDVDLLGNRPRDAIADWSSYYDRHPELCRLKRQCWYDL